VDIAVLALAPCATWQQRLTVLLLQGDRMIGKKWPIFKKSCQNSYQAKNVKISTSKFNLNSIIPTFNPFWNLNTYNKPCFETANIFKKVLYLLKQKVTQNITISLGYFTLSKNHNDHPKVAHLDWKKISKSGHPVSL
jgi:hypothetical protein